MWHIAGRRQAWRRYVVVAIILVLGISLAACGGRLPTSRTTPQSVQVSATSSASLEPSMKLTPDQGYGGLYIQVSGEHWPPNMMVLVTLEDERGRSETLAATDTDQAGNLSTGFLYPIDERWLASIPRRVVVTTADGRTEVKSKFGVVEPGTETDVIAAEPESPSESLDAKEATSETVDNTEITSSEVLSHMVALPLVSADASSGNRTGGRSDRASASDITQVKIQIASGQKSNPLNCRNGQEVLRIVILTTEGFNASAVDPGTVTVTGGQAGNGLGAAEFSANMPVAWNPRASAIGFKMSAEDPPRGTQVSQGWGGYQWRWNLEDVDQDGDEDLVIEYRLNYIKLNCDATALTIQGRTKDGQSFSSVNQITMTKPGRG